MKLLFKIMLFFIPIFGYSQNWMYKPISIELINNATMLPPASMTAIAKQPLHPGIVLGYEFGWKEKERSKWYQTAKLGYYYHQFVNQNIQLYTEFGYRQKIKKLMINGGLLGGYLHQIPLSKKIVLQSDGTYDANRNFGRAQAMVGATIGTGYNLGTAEQPFTLLLNYQFWVQTPFVSGYVPVLPNGTLSLGVQFKLHKAK